MILGSEQLATLLGQADSSDDPLVITPPPDLVRLKKSGSASVDLRLGTWFLALRQARMTCLDISESLPEAKLTKTQYVRFGDYYYLHAGSFVLGVTLEWVRLPRNLAAYVIGRSSWGRRGLIIATATGVHPGFTGCLTLELTNVGNIPIAISPGMEVCQLFVHQVSRGESKATDQSAFLGSRKPSLGSIKQDSVARKLAKWKR